MTNLQRYATYYTKNMKLPIFPCTGKRPATSRGFLDATTDRAQIEEWWNDTSTYNIGVPTGNGLVVLDVDINHTCGKYGDETLADLEQQYGPLPDTWIALSGGGGVHYYFDCTDPALTIAAGFAPGLDYRGAGGYVIVPPSVHDNGREYVWEVNHTPTSCPLAPLPEWLHRLMLQSKKSPTKTAYEIPEKVSEGKRNQEMFRLASSLRAKGLTIDEILPAVTKANDLRCAPPLAEREIKSLCESAGRYERGSTDSKFSTVKPPDLSDAGNAEIFADLHKSDLIYTDSLGWLWWTGKRWERNDHTALSYALDFSTEMLNEAKAEFKRAADEIASATCAVADGTGNAQQLSDAKAASVKAVAFLNHAKNTRGSSRLKALLELAKPSLVIKADTLDATPYHLNTPTGIIDLRTKQVLSHDSSAYCTQITAVSPGTDGAQMWTDFLDKITQGDGSIQGFLQLVAGMALFGAVYHEGIIIAYGGGRNGKSTFFNALGAALGDYSGSIAVQVLTTDKANRGASLATLRGKRLVITDELEEHQRLSVATLKQLASTDKLVIEEKYRQPETVSPSHSLVLFTNFLPRVGSTDEGTWRRLIVVPFNATIPTQGAIANYGEVLAREAGPAILSWAIEGAANFARNGFKLDIPDTVAEATETYRAREDWLSNFLNERCIKGPSERVRASELYAEYRNWAQESGDFVRRVADFTAGMEAAGFQNIKPQNKSTWVGLKIDHEARYSSTYPLVN